MTDKATPADGTPETSADTQQPETPTTDSVETTPEDDEYHYDEATMRQVVRHWF